MKIQITQSLPMHFCSKFCKPEIIHVANVNQSRPCQKSRKMLILRTTGAIWNHQLPRKEIHSQTKHWIELSPSLPSWVSSFQQDYFCVLWRVLKHQLSERGSNQTETLSEINGASNSAFLKQPWTCHCRFCCCCPVPCKSNSHPSELLFFKVSPELGTWEGFNNHQWVWRENTALISLIRGFFHSKDKLSYGIFYVETGNNFYGQSPARVAAGIPCPQEHEMKPLGHRPRLERALLLVCTVDFPARSSHTPGSSRLSILWATRTQLWFCSTGLLKGEREQSPAGWGASTSCLTPFVSVAFAAGIWKGQIFLKPQPGVYCFLITDLVPQIKGFTLLLYKKYAEHGDGSSVTSIKMSPTISSFY